MFVNKFFKLSENNTTIRTEVLAGLTTFLTMSYIVVVNPAILGQAGINHSAAFVATCLTAIIGTGLCAILANYPIAIAPSLALNAFFTYAVVKGFGFSWQLALTCVFVAGIIFLILTILRIRQWIISAIPHSQAVAIAAGIGLFIGFIALKEAGIIVGSKTTLIAMGNITEPGILLFFVGFCLIVFFEEKKFLGSILISIILVSILGTILGYNQFHGVIAMPPSLSPTFFKLDFSALSSPKAFNVIFTFLLVALFDSTGTLLGLLHLANFHQDERKMKKITQALIAEGVATTCGALLGTSTTSPYIESATGIQAKGRTGLTSFVVMCGFVFLLFFAPLAQSIPVYAYAPALLYVACKMFMNIVEVDWQQASEAFPAILTMLMIPLTFSIINGIAIGFIAYVVLKLITGQYRKITLSMVLLTLLFVIYFAVVDQASLIKALTACF